MTPIQPYISMSLIDTCNMRCVYCPPAGENYRTPHAQFDPEKACQVIDLAAELQLGKVRFTGGEPTLYPHLERVTCHAVQRDLQVHINTNGVLLDRHLDWMEGLPGLVVKVSLDAVTSEGIYQMSGVHQANRIMSAIRRGALAGVVQRLNLVLTRLNAAEVPQILSLCSELGLSLKIFDMYPVPETADLWERLYAPIASLKLEGTPLPEYEYASHFGTPTQELLVGGVPVRLKNCFNGTRYHPVSCANCAHFPCSEGLYCLLVTPSLTVVPCRQGEHLHRPCSTLQELRRVVEDTIELYAGSQYANPFADQHAGFHCRQLNLPAACPEDRQHLVHLHKANTGLSVGC